MASPPVFRLFGFPIHVRSGFLLFMVLVIFVNGGELGVWIAGSAAVLTLLHELGHAFAARSTGAHAEIALDFLAGYASFVPVRPLSRWERAGISVAGPAVQIGVSVAVLTLMGVNPLDPESFRQSPAALAIWWTGPVMGLFNLVPVLPLDGGHIMQAGLDALVPGRSREVMLYFSIGLTGALALLLLASETYRGFGMFAILPIIAQVQMLRVSKSPRREQRPSAGANGEALAWATGDVSAIPPGLLPSPWFRAAQQLDQGHPDIARDLLIADFAEAERPNWWPPTSAPRERLAAVAALLPRPLPRGRAYSEQVLADVLLRIGSFEEAARYGADSFERHPSTASAVVVARAAGGLGDTDTAVGWLRAAYHADTDVAVLQAVMDGAPELEPARSDERFEKLRRQLAAD